MKTTLPGSPPRGGPEDTFLPPLDLDAPRSDVWGLAWDRQVSATGAWQEAAAHAGPPSAVVPTMRTVMRMSTLLVSLRERLLQIQNEAANVAIAEMAQRRAAEAVDQDAGETVDPVPLPELHPENAGRIADLAGQWFDCIASAHAGMTALVGRIGLRSVRAATEKPRLLTERRQRSVTIDFADRRRRAMA